MSLVRTDIVEAIQDGRMGCTPEMQLQTLVVAELNADRHIINDAIHAARHEKGDTDTKGRMFTVLEPPRVPDNALRAAEIFVECTGAVTMMNERCWTVVEVDTQDVMVTLRNASRESMLIFPRQSIAQDISLFTPRDLTISRGGRMRFTRLGNDRGCVTNNLWEVVGFTDDGVICFRQGEQEKTVDPRAMTENRHIDLAYTLTVYDVRGTSERFAIALTDTEGGGKRMASLESTYATLSQARGYVQIHTDDLAGWSAGTRHLNAGQAARDLLHQKSDYKSDIGDQLLVTAPRLDRTALERRVLTENDLEDETMACFIAAGRKYSTSYVALPAWTRHGQEAGALLTEIRIGDDGMRVMLNDESQLHDGEDAQSAGLQANCNGQILTADDAQTALCLTQENLESGVVIRLHSEERLFNAARLTGGRITEPDEVVRTVRSAAEVRSAAKAEDPITLPPGEQQKLAEAQEKMVRELAEQTRQELLPAVSGEESTRPEPLLSTDEECRPCDGIARGERKLDEAIQEAVAEGRDIRQQVYEQMLRTEREWVANVPEKNVGLEETLGEDWLRGDVYMVTRIIIIAILSAGLVVLLRQADLAWHPPLQRLCEKGTRPDRTELLLRRWPSFASTGQLMMEREWRSLHRLDKVANIRQWRLYPQVRVADTVRVASDRKPGSREWWQLSRPVSQWHCDVAITNHAGRIIAAVALDDHPHQALKHQRHNLLLEEVLKQAGTPLLRGDDEQQLAEHVRARLCTQRPEAAA